jgi:prepilin-type N-terminal cleavage/methylation domain-containing protein
MSYIFRESKFPGVFSMFGQPVAKRGTRCRRYCARQAFTLIEVLMVVTTLAIIAGVVVPQVSTVIDEAKNSALLRDLREFTTAIERYRMEHNGGAPDIIENEVLVQLLKKTDADGRVGTGPQYTYGPYLVELPRNALNGVTRVFRINSAPPSNLASRVGWVYHPESGQIWAGLYPEHVDLSNVQAGWTDGSGS